MASVDEFLTSIGECGWQGCLRPPEVLKNGRLSDLCKQHKNEFLESLQMFLGNVQHTNDGVSGPAISLKHLEENCKITSWMLLHKRSVEALATAPSVHPELKEFSERVRSRLGTSVWESFIVAVKEYRAVSRGTQDLQNQGMKGHSIRSKHFRSKADTGRTVPEPPVSGSGMTIQPAELRVNPQECCMELKED